MRVAPWAWISVGLFLGACSDEKPAPIVNEDIAWALGCASGECNVAFYPHDQAEDIELPFQIDCGYNGSYFNVTVRDPGRVQEVMTSQGLISARAPSSMRLTNVDLDRGSCNVQVSEQSPGDSAPFEYNGDCDGECTLEPMSTEGGWDFVARLTCDGLTAFGNDPEGAPRFSLTQPDGSGGVLIKVGNCD